MSAPPPGQRTCTVPERAGPVLALTFIGTTREPCPVVGSAPPFGNSHVASAVMVHEQLGPVSTLRPDVAKPPLEMPMVLGPTAYKHPVLKTRIRSVKARPTATLLAARTRT